MSNKSIRRSSHPYFGRKVGFEPLRKENDVVSDKKSQSTGYSGLSTAIHMSRKSGIVALGALHHMSVQGIALGVILSR